MKHATSGIKLYSDDKRIYNENINSITFYNQGDVTGIVNGLLRIAPRMTFAISQSDTEIVDVTSYDLSFDLNDPDTTGVNKAMIVLTIKIKKIN